MRTLLIERGRHVTHKTDYQDFAAPWELAHRGQVPEDEARRDYAIQSTCYAFNSATRQWWVQGQRASVPHARRPRVPLAARLSPRWPVADLGAADLSLQRHRFRRQQERRPRRRLADSLCRHFAVVRPRRNLCRHFRQQRRTRAVARRPFSEADGSQLRRARFQAQAREQPSVAPRHIGRCAHLTEPTAEHIALGRGPCQLRNVCERGCGYGGYFSTLSATLPAAERTGNLTVVTDAIVETLDYDHAKRRISAVRVIDAKTKQRRSYQARVVFLCASTIPTAQILLHSKSEFFPNGSREPLGPGRPQSHGPRARHRRHRATCPASSIATTTGAVPPASTFRATPT